MIYRNFIKEFKKNLKNINISIKPINPIFSKSFIYSKHNLNEYYYNYFLQNIEVEEHLSKKINNFEDYFDDNDFED
jgi:hypothetical protein